MSIETLGNLGEFVGSIAVVASLLYLAIQMRQNSQLVRTSNYQTGASWTLSALSSVGQSSETARVFTQGLADPRELSGAEQAQFATLMSMIMTGLAIQHRHHRLGRRGESDWPRQERIAVWYASMPGFQRWLRSNEALMDPDLLAHLETISPDLRSERVPDDVAS